MTTLALDLGTTIGFALRRSSGEIESGVHPFDPGIRDGQRFLAFRAWLHEMKRTCDARKEPITLIRFERVDFIIPGQVYAAHTWGGMWATLTAWAEHHQINYRGVAVNTIKSKFCRDGHAKKPAIIAECRRRGFSVNDDNHADAIAILLMDEPKARAA